jgi:hypothetical protein
VERTAGTEISKTTLIMNDYDENNNNNNNNNHSVFKKNQLDVTFCILLFLF